MELAGSGYLYTIAVAAITFAGFSGLTVIFRQILGGQLTRLDSFVLRIFIQLGFLAAAGSLLPPLLALFYIPPANNWRISSAVLAMLFGLWALTYPRRRHNASPSIRMPFPVWCVIAVFDVTVFVVAANAIFPLGAWAVGIYCAAVTVILFGGATFFLFSLIFLFEQPVESIQPRPKS